jgi:hypothetical protein
MARRSLEHRCWRGLGSDGFAPNRFHSHDSAAAAGARFESVRDRLEVVEIAEEKIVQEFANGE